MRRGFFEGDQVDAFRQHLPEPMRGIPAFAFLTGWRTPSEIIPLEWRQVDWAAEEVRLDRGTTLAIVRAAHGRAPDVGSLRRNALADDPAPDPDGRPMTSSVVPHGLTAHLPSRYRQT